MKIHAILITLLFSISALAQNVNPLGEYQEIETDHVCSKVNPIERYTYIPNALLEPNKVQLACATSFSQWAEFDGENLIAELISYVDYECFRPLFSYEVGIGQELYSHENIDLVSNKLVELSATFDGENHNGSYGLLLYLHTAIYHEFFQSEITFSDDNKTNYLAALHSYAGNQNIYNLTTRAMRNMIVYYTLCDAESVRHDPIIFESIKKSLRMTAIDQVWRTIEDDFSLLYDYQRAYNNIFFYMYRGIVNNDTDFINLLDTDSEFHTLLTDLILVEELECHPTLDLFVPNAYVELLRQYGKSPLEDNVEPQLARIANSKDRLSNFWYRAVVAINEAGNCELYNLCEDLPSIKEEVLTVLFPNEWRFDDGRMIIKTPLDYEIAQQLYYASKEVEAQFFRLMESDEALEDDNSENLSLVVYGTKKAYNAWQYELNGLNTNNGGIYIEGDATFYTYERTTQESIYTLEELFRHEYTHYLQGRFMDPGLWGQTPFYNNEEITWFNEGLAEYLAGSTDTEGVIFRQTVGNRLSSDNPNSRMKVKDIVSAKYNSGFTFYRYAYALIDYLANNDKAKLRDILNLIKADNIDGYKAVIESLKSDVQLQSDFENYLISTQLVESYWRSVETEWQADNTLNLNTPQEAQQLFTDVSSIEVISAELTSEDTIRRFTITAEMPSTDRDNFLDELLISLAEADVANNFDDLVGYYKKENGIDQLVISGSLNNISVGVTETNALGASIIHNLEHNYIQIFSDQFPLGASIIDGSGRIISHQKVLSAQDQISTFDLNHGIYFIRISGNDSFKTIPFVQVD